MLAVAASACGGSTDDETGASSVTHMGQLVSFEDPLQPLEGVQVCVDGNSNIACVTTPATGRYTLAGLPANSDLVFTFSHPNIYPTIRMFHTNDFDPPFVQYSLTSTQAFADLLTTAGRRETNGRGHIAFDTFDADGQARVDNVQAVLGPPSGEVFYLDDLGRVDFDRMGTAGPGIGGALNVIPGETNVILTTSDGPCTAEPHAWAGRVSGSIRVDVRAGMLAVAGAVRCTVR